MSLKAAVIGCGSIARFHFAGLEKAGVEVAWVCDLNADAARPWQEKTGARYAADYEKALRDPEVGVVVVTTISAAHRAICIAAMEAGKAVICEKTLAGTAAEALAIVCAAEARGAILYTSYMKRFIPAVERARALLPTLGTILTTHIRAHQPWGQIREHNPKSTESMSMHRRRYGGGILVCGGSHILDLVCFLNGRPTRLYANIETPEGFDIDLRASAMLETPNGVVLYEALAHPLKHVGFLRDGWDERIEITGTEGRLEFYSSLWNDVTSKASYLVHYDNQTGQATEYRFPPVSPFERAVGFFCENIRSGAQGAQSIYTGYDVDELIATMLRSAEIREAVEVVYRAGP